MFISTSHFFSSDITTTSSRNIHSKTLPSLFTTVFFSFPDEIFWIGSSEKKLPINLDYTLISKSVKQQTWDVQTLCVLVFVVGENVVCLETCFEVKFLISLFFFLYFGHNRFYL